MAAKKDKGGIEALRNDVQALADAFWKFRDAMITDIAAQQAEQQQKASKRPDGGDWIMPDDATLQSSASMMNALAQPQRLRMMLILTQQPTSVTALVEQLGLKTTGAAYHHLNVLMNSGLVIQPERGIFALSPDATPQIRPLLVALFGAAPSQEKSRKPKKKQP